MKKDVDLFEKLKTFICPHPVLHPEAGDIFTPQGKNIIKFFFEGGFVVEGKAPELEINFNDDDLVILAIGKSVFRFKKSALLGFELRIDPVQVDPTDMLEIKGLLH